MNILDENIVDSQRRLLRSWRISTRQIGYEVGRQGMDDEEIIPFCINYAVRPFLPVTRTFMNATYVMQDIVWFTWLSERMR